MLKRLPILVLAALVACGGSTPKPSSQPPATSDVAGAPAATTQAPASTEPDDAPLPLWPKPRSTAP